MSGSSDYVDLLAVNETSVQPQVLSRCKENIYAVPQFFRFGDLKLPGKIIWRSMIFTNNNPFVQVSSQEAHGEEGYVQHGKM